MEHEQTILRRCNLTWGIYTGKLLSMNTTTGQEDTKQKTHHMGFYADENIWVKFSQVCKNDYGIAPTMALRRLIAYVAISGKIPGMDTIRMTSIESGDFRKDLTK